MQGSQRFLISHVHNSFFIWSAISVACCFVNVKRNFRIEAPMLSVSAYVSQGAPCYLDVPSGQILFDCPRLQANHARSRNSSCQAAKCCSRPQQHFRHLIHDHLRLIIVLRSKPYANFSSDTHKNSLFPYNRICP